MKSTKPETKPGVTVKRNSVEPEPVEVIAQSILDIATGVKAILATRLTRKAIVVLIQYQSKLPMRDIECVLNNLEDLEKDWLKTALR